jgi:hypothetical protein
VPRRPAARTAGHARVLVADIAGQHAHVVGQGECHGECAVAGESADLDRAPRAEQLDQQGHELALIGGDLHAGMRMRSRRFAQRCLRRVLAQRMGEHVLEEVVVDLQGAQGHGQAS